MSLWFEYENDSIGIRTSPDVSSAFALTLILTHQVTRSVTNALKVKELITNVVKKIESKRNLVLNQFISLLVYLLWKEELYILENNTISQRRKFHSRVQAILKQTFSIVSEFYFQWETLQITVCENNRKKRWENDEKTLRKRWESRKSCQNQSQDCTVRQTCGPTQKR